jgi:flagellin
MSFSSLVDWKGKFFMSLTIANNVSSLVAQGNFANASSMLSTTLQRLSSGLKINSGADGPAALVISEQQRAQIAGLNTALDNTAKAITVVQTGEGALNEVNSLLSKARSLALDAANSGVNDQNALNADQAELSNILSTIDNIANTTQFGTKKLLNGSAGIAVTQSPANYTVTGTGATLGGSYTLSGFTAAVKANSLAGTAFATAGGVIAADAGNLTINGVNIALDQTNANSLAAATQTINGYSSQTGVTAVNNGGKLQLVSNSFGSAGNFTATFASANLATDVGFAGASIITSSNTLGTAASNAAGTLTDGGGNTFTGVANGNTLNFNSGNATGLSITFGASGTTSTVGANGDVVSIQNNSLVFQIGANASQTATVAFNNAQSSAIGQNASGLVNNSFTSLSTIKINTTPSDAQDAIRVIDKAIQDVTNQRGTLGAFQAITLVSTTNNLHTMLQNTTAAESTVRDTDFAAETANLAKYQVLTQAGAAVLSSSNQTSQLVLSLLQKL